MGQGTESCGGYEIEYDPYEEGLADGMWMQSNHSLIRIVDMTTSHIRNAIRTCEQARELANFSCDKDKWDEWINNFEDELYSRGESKFEIKAPAHYDDSSKVKATRGTKIELICHCGKKYSPRIADLKRGWGKSCSKRCASIKRDFGRRDPVNVNGLSLKTILKNLQKE